MKIGFGEKILIGAVMRSKNMKTLLANWRTTFAGIATIAGGLSAIFTTLADGWQSGDADLIITGGTMVAGGIGLIAGRDAKVSSESSGAK